MSAYMVEDVTINRVVTYLAGDVSAWPVLPEGDDIDALLGQAMFALNVRAVEACYGEGEAAEFRPLDYKYRYAPASPVQVLKSLDCWLYQCAEGNVPDDALYRHFETFVRPRIALGIVRSMPEYDTAKWG